MTSELHIYARGQDPHIVNLGDLTLVIHQGSPVPTTPVVTPSEVEIVRPAFVPRVLPSPYQNYIVAPGQAADVVSILNAQKDDEHQVGVVIGDLGTSTPKVEQWRAVTEGLVRYTGPGASIHLITADEARANE